MPPANLGQLSTPSAKSPWHTAQCSANTSSPVITSPDPAGRPSPLGETSRFHAAISSGRAGRPRPILSAKAGAAPTSVAMAVLRARLRYFDIFSLPGRVYMPGLDAVVVV